MAGYIGSKSSVTLVDGYSEAEADAEFVTKAGDTMTGDLNLGANTLSLGANNANSPQILFENSDGVTGDAALSTYDDSLGTMLVMGSNFYINSSGSETRFNTSEESSAVMLNRNGDLNLMTGGTGATATTRLKIDSSGNVGIGTDSPDTKIQIKGAVNSSQLILGGTDGRGLKISTTNEGGQDDSSVIFDAQDTESSGVNSTLIFKNGGTESFRISGNRTKDFGSFEGFSGGYNSKFKAGSAASYAVRMDAPGTGSAGILQVVNGYGQVGSIRVNGASTYFFTSSDYRLKTDVQPMTGASARVQALNPVNFEWIADGNRTDGFLAHEAQAVVPESVVGVKDAMKDEPYEVTPAVEATYDEEGNELTASVEAVMGTRSIPDHQSIDQSKLVPLLTAALQEALTEIASLKTRVEALEA